MGFNSGFKGLRNVILASFKVQNLHLDRETEKTFRELLPWHLESYLSRVVSRTYAKPLSGTQNTYQNLSTN